jgi:hypothetical protein
MANRNTAIRGIQIRDGEITLTQLASSIGTSLGKADSAYQLPVGGITTADLSSGVVASLGLADSALQSLAFTGLTDSPGAYSGNALKVIRVNTGATGLEYYTLPGATDMVELEDFALEDLSADANGIKVDYVLAVTPGANLQVYLNGLLQQKGSGKDYTVVTDTVTFAEAPETGDIVIFTYVMTS